MEPEQTGEFDYWPFFYSRVFTLSWQYYGENVGEVVHFGDYSGSFSGAYWVSMGHVVGSFLEGGTKEEYEAISKTARLRPEIDDLADLERQGLGFSLAIGQKMAESQVVNRSSSAVGGSVIVMEKPLYVWHAAAGVVVATCIAVFALWYGRW